MVPDGARHTARRDWSLAVGIGLCLAAMTPAMGQGAAGGVLAAWTELTPVGPAVRAVTTAATCPLVTITAPAADGAAAPPTAMRVRALPAPPAFPDLTCEWTPPPGTRAVGVAGWPAALPLLAPEPRRIVVFGDSGCLGGYNQDCAGGWPFADIARFAAARQPDLVIHLGDYNYRGTNCVAYDACCTYNPDTCGFPDCGDNWSTWNEDFFAPAAPLLAAAPWLMVRGNHELCSRAGRGWFRYLDPHSPPRVCAANPVEEPTFTQPYALTLGSALRLLVLDSANACGEFPVGDQIARYRDQFARLDEEASAGRAVPTWLLSHKSPWSIVRDTPASRMVLNYTLQRASKNRLPGAISLVLSGHEHLFQALAFRDRALPPVVVVGTGGDELDDPAWVPPQVNDVPVGVDGPTIAAATTVHDHGYLVIELAGSEWTGTFYDRFDQPLANCASTARPAPCSPVAP